MSVGLPASLFRVSEIPIFEIEPSLTPGSIASESGVT